MTIVTIQFVNFLLFPLTHIIIKYALTHALVAILSTDGCMWVLPKR